jgi:hypothetical protein
MWAKAAVVWGVARPGGKCAKRTQFGPAGGQTCETNPIWPGRAANAQNKAKLGRRGKMSGGDAQPTKRQNAQNEANFGRAEARDCRLEIAVATRRSQ